MNRGTYKPLVLINNQCKTKYSDQFLKVTPAFPKKSEKKNTFSHVSCRLNTIEGPIYGDST